jgi:hypothetical protein
MVASLSAARAALEASAPSAPRDALLGRIDACVRRLALPAAGEPVAIDRALRIAASAAAVVASSGAIDAVAMDLVAAARDATLERSAPGGLCALGPAPGPIGAMHASRGRPNLHRTERAPFEWDLCAGAAMAAENAGDVLEAALPEAEAVAVEAAPRAADAGGLRARGRSRAISISEWRARTVAQTLERLALVARARLDGPLGGRASADDVMLRLADAGAAAGSACVRDVLAAWERAVEWPGPWASFAATLVLGCLDGGDALDAVLFGAERLPIAAGAHARAIADALAIAPHPERGRLAEKLVVRAHPIARAAGVELLGRSGTLEPRELLRHLLDGRAPVMAAAVRAAARLGPEACAPLVPALERWLRLPAPDVAWAAAETLTRWGSPIPLRELRERGELGAIIGRERALELMVMAGARDDLELVERLARSPAPSARTLDAVARFGEPGAWAFLAHHLADPDLVDAAAGALSVQFGERLARRERRRAGAWRSAIEALGLDAGVRVRAGEPWSPGAVARQWQSDELSASAVRRLLGELGARAGIGGDVDVEALWSDLAPGLERATAEALRRAWPANGWG